VAFTVVGAHHLATFRKDKKAKYGEPYCMVKAAGQTQATTTASFNGSDLEWSDPVMQLYAFLKPSCNL
jgi:hypothetical protein